MAALTQGRNTRAKFDTEVAEFGVAASTTIYYGAMVAVNASGYAVPASADSTLRIVGVNLEKDRDNSSGSAGDINVRVTRAPAARYANSAGADAIAATDRGLPCYAQDDQTLALTDNDGARPRAGKILDVDSDGVWVSFREDRDNLVSVELPLITGINTGSATGSILCPVAGRVIAVLGKASSDPGADTVMAGDIDGVAITGGAPTLANGGTATDFAYPTAANRVAAGDLLTATSDNGATNAVDAYVTFLISAD